MTRKEASIMLVDSFSGGKLEIINPDTKEKVTINVSPGLEKRIEDIFYQE